MGKSNKILVLEAELRELNLAMDYIKENHPQVYEDAVSHAVNTIIGEEEDEQKRKKG